MSKLHKTIALIQTGKPFNHLSGMLPFIGGFLVTYEERTSSWLHIVITFITFLFFYSAVYRMNEVFDIERDKQDPVRNHRPLAQGLVRKKDVILLAVTIGVSSTILLTLIDSRILIWLLLLVLLNFFYVTILKNFMYIDFLLMSTSHIGKFFVGVLATTTMRLTLEESIIGLFFYAIVAVLQCNKKIGLLLYHQHAVEPGKNHPSLKVLKKIRFFLLLLAIYTLLISTTSILLPAMIFLSSLVFFIVLLELHDGFRTAFFSYQKWFSKL
ncbi:UbiA family prenyltransferase [bacterium]|nr:UbiA family prenyltransferase [bacterium]